MLPPQLTSKTEGGLTLEQQTAAQLWMIQHDPEHAWLTGEAVAHPPSLTERAARWYQTGAYQRLNKLLTRKGNHPS